jgi:CBS domain-containing protein
MEKSELTNALSRIADDLRAKHGTFQMSVRELVRLAGADRRTVKTSLLVGFALSKFNLKTDPDFNAAPLDGVVDFRLRTENDFKKAQKELEGYASRLSSLSDVNTSPPTYVFGAASDPSFRLSRLPASNTTLISVKPDDALIQAVTLMLRHDYSQLPVMTNEREVKGVISWGSIAPVLILGGERSGAVREYMTPHKEVNASDSIFQAIPQIVENSYVLVRSDDRKISGIITTVDLSLLFQQLSEPFLLLSEIENHIRKLIDGKFTKSQLAGAANQSDSREVESVADLTFGEYIRLFQVDKNWSRVGLKVDKTIFIKELDKVRIIRNNIMHFDPDGISDDDHKLLRHFVRFMQQLQEIS